MKLLLSAFALRTWGDRIDRAADAGLSFVTAEEALAADGPCGDRHRLHDPRGHRQVEQGQSDAGAARLRGGAAQVAEAALAADPSGRRRAADLSRAARPRREGDDRLGRHGGDGVAQRPGGADRDQPALPAAGRCPAPPCLGAAPGRALAARSQGPVRGDRRHGPDRAQHRGAAEDAGHERRSASAARPSPSRPATRPSPTASCSTSCPRRTG